MLFSGWVGFTAGRSSSIMGLLAGIQGTAAELQSLRPNFLEAPGSSFLGGRYLLGQQVSGVN